MVVVGVVNLIAAVVFAAALCWRLEQIRRQGGGLQPIAMTTAIAALTLAFVVSNDDVSEAIDTVFFTGAQRVAFYALLALGVAALIIVFFFPDRSTSRERRAGIEAIPLVVALIGLQVTMLVIPTDLRTENISDWTVKNVAFALFVLIASGYLAYGFIACVRSIRRFFQLSEGYLRTSLGLLLGGLALLAISSLMQIVFVVGAGSGVLQWAWLMRVSRVISVIGVVAFLVGISYPMLHGRWQMLATRRRAGRHADDLLPLWQLVTGVVPEVVLPATGVLSAPMRLRRRVVEIRDALTQLSPYLSPDFEVVDDEARAEMLEMAVEQYRIDGRPSGAVWDVLPSDGGDLEADAEPLVRVSRLLGSQPSH